MSKFVTPQKQNTMKANDEIIKHLKVKAQATMAIYYLTNIESLEKKIERLYHELNLQRSETKPSFEIVNELQSRISAAEETMKCSWEEYYNYSQKIYK